MRHDFQNRRVSDSSLGLPSLTRRFRVTGCMLSRTAQASFAPSDANSFTACVLVRLTATLRRTWRGEIEASQVRALRSIEQDIAFERQEASLCQGRKISCNADSVNERVVGNGAALVRRCFGGRRNLRNIDISPCGELKPKTKLAKRYAEPR